MRLKQPLICLRFLAAVVSTVYCPKKYPYLFGQVTYIEIENHLRWIARVFLGGFF